MSAKTDLIERDTLRYWLVPAQSVTARPTSHTVHLYTVTAGETGGGTEVVGGSYAAQAIVFQEDGQAAGGGAQVSNNATINFPQATANYPSSVVASGVKDNAGNLLYYGPLVVSITVLSGDTPQFLTGQYKIEER